MRVNWHCLFVVVVAPVLFACATNQVNIVSEIVPEEQSVTFMQEMNFSNDGLPVFSNLLRTKPKHTGEAYFQVLYENAKPQAAYLVGVVGENKADWSRPFATIFHWTDQGLEIAARILENTMDGCMRDQASLKYGDLFGDLFFCSAIGTVGAAVTATGSFLIGTAASAPVFVQELQRSLDPTRERLLIVMRMQYDTVGRLRSYTFELPDDRAGQQVITSQCSYDGNSTRPRECAVSSTPEQIMRRTGYGL